MSLSPVSFSLSLPKETRPYCRALDQSKFVRLSPLLSGEDGSPPAKKRKQKNPEKSHVEGLKREGLDDSEQTEESMDQDELVDQLVEDEQQMLTEEVVETVVQNEEVNASKLRITRIIDQGIRSKLLTNGVLDMARLWAKFMRARKYLLTIL